MENRVCALVIGVWLCLLAGTAHAQVRFRFTPNGGTEATREYSLSGNPATDQSGTATETDLSTGQSTTRTWVRDGDDIVVEGSSGSERARFTKGRIQEEGDGTIFPGTSGHWINIDYLAPDPE